MRDLPPRRDKMLVATNIVYSNQMQSAGRNNQLISLSRAAIQSLAASLSDYLHNKVFDPVSQFAVKKKN